MADTERAVSEIDELIKLAQLKIEQDDSIGIDAEDVGNLTIGKAKMNGYKTPVKLRNVGEAKIEVIEGTAPDELSQIIPLLMELRAEVKVKQKDKKVYEKIIDKFAAFGGWASVILNLLHYTGYS